MLGRKVAGNGSFICLRCRLQQQLSLSSPRAVRRPTFSYPSYAALSSFSSRPSLPTPSQLSAATIFQRGVATDSAPAPDPLERPKPESPTVTTNNFFDDADPQPVSQGEKFITPEEFANAFSWTAEEGEVAQAEPAGRTQEQEQEQEQGQEQGQDPFRPKMARWWKRKDMRVTAKGEALPLDILGQPGSALVVRELGKLPLRTGFRELEPLSPVKLDIASLLDQIVDSKPTVEEYLLNIHEMQPQDSRLVSTKEFLELKDALVKGFTAPQLRSYITHWKTAQKIQANNKPRTDRPWIVERRPWVPIIENAVDTDEPELYGYILPGMAPKERDAIRVMRTCWDLSVREVAAGQGYLDVRFRDVEFGLLTLGSQIWLQHIARRYLKPGKQIELYRQSNFASIMAPMHTAYSILETINLFLDNTVTVRFSTSLISSSPLHFEPAILNKLGLMTSSVVRMEPSGREISVTWVELPDRKRKPELEDPGEMVLRLLIYAYRSRPRSSFDLKTVPEAVEGRYLPEIDCEPKLPWQERPSKWARWTASLPSSNLPDASSAVRGPTQSGHIPSGMLPFPIEDKGKDEPLPINGNWSPEPLTETSAIFGHVLFSREATKQPSLAAPESLPVPRVSLPHTFSPILPSMRALKLRTNLHEEGLWHTIVVMRLIPAPDLPKEILAAAPELEVRLEADHQEVQRIISLRAVTDRFTGDVLFPTSHVDVRLRQTRFYELQGRDVEKHAEPIIAFLEDSDLRPWEGKIATPPNLDGIRLPLKFLSPQPKSEALNKESGDLVKMDYMFGGLEIRRTVTAEHEGLKIRYTNIEGGHRRGRRSELSLDAVAVDTSKLKDGVPDKSLLEEGRLLESKYVRGLEMTDRLDVDAAARALGVEEEIAGGEFQKKMPERAPPVGSAFDNDDNNNSVINNPATIAAGKRIVTEEEFFLVASRIATGESSVEWYGKYKGTS